MTAPARFAGLTRRPTLGSPLTSRQREIVALVAEGYTDREVGDLLYITEGTVGVLLGRIMAKLGARNRAATVHLAWKTGVLSMSEADPARTDG